MSARSVPTRSPTIAPARSGCSSAPSRKKLYLPLEAVTAVLAGERRSHLETRIEPMSHHVFRPEARHPSHVRQQIPHFGFRGLKAMCRLDDHLGEVDRSGVL
jgi:hypothetical protein